MPHQSIEYRTFDELLSDVKNDLRMLNAENFIDSSQLIKVAMKINKELGFRIQKTKETVIEINNHKAKLPDEFLSLNYAILCGDYSRETRLPSTVRECASNENIVCDCTGTINETCTLIQTTLHHVTVFKEFYKIYIKPSKYVDRECLNTAIGSDYTYSGEVRDGWLYTNVDSGNAYLCYQSQMVDDEGNLIVPNHPILNQYYESALKTRILENMMFSNEDVINKLKYMQEMERVHRIEATGLANMPDYHEMLSLRKTNRKAMYNRYYSFIQSAPSDNW